MGRHQEAISDLAESEQFYSAIGRFIQEFSYLEFSLKSVITAASGLDEEYEDQILSHDFNMLCTIAQNIAARRLDKDRALEFEVIIKKCRTLNIHRVRVAHGFWIGRFGEAGALLHISRQKLESNRYYHHANEVAELADEAEECGGELWAFMRW